MDREICSRSAVERYALNMMDRQQECLFQEHLDSCAECREYLSRIRVVSEIVREQEAAAKRPLRHLYAWTAVAACIATVVVLSFYFQQSNGAPETTLAVVTDTVAAGSETTDSVPVRKEAVRSPGNDNVAVITPPATTSAKPTPPLAADSTSRAGELRIDRVSKATNEVVATPPEMIYPLHESVVAFNSAAGEPFAFRWSGNRHYVLRLNEAGADSSEVVTRKGHGEFCELTPEEITRYRRLDWTIEFEGARFTGRIIVLK